MVLAFDEAVAETSIDIALVLNTTSGQTRDEVRVDEISTMAAEQVWNHILGMLRYQFPEPVPHDLLSVGKSAGLRIAKGMVDTGSLLLRAGDVVTQMEYRPWMGFMIVERMILDRYRKTVA